MSDVLASEPIMLRASITREELRALKMLALAEGTTVQDLLAKLIRQRITTREG